MPSVYGAIDLQKNELRNAAVQSLASPPASPVAGQLYFDSTPGDLTLYWYDGSQWIAAKAAAGATPAGTVSTSAVGDAGVVGISTNFAREDHKHGREAFANPTATTTFGLAAVNGSAATLARSDHTHGTPTHDAAAHSAIPISALAAAAADVSHGGFKITNLGAPSAGTDGANKDYVDNISAGVSWKDGVRAATTVNGTLASAFQNAAVIDGVTLATGNRILLKNQTAPAENGIYTVNASGAPTRALDADAAAEIEAAAVFVNEGTTQADTAWVMTTNAPITLGTTGLVWTQFGSGTIAADSVDNTKLANMAANTIKGNNTGGSTDPLDLTVTQTTAMLNLFTTASVKGLAPGSTGGTVNFLRADATWADPLTGAARKFAGALTGTVSPETVTHNLNTRDIQLTVLNGATPYTAVEVDWDATTVNTAVVRFSPALGAGYRVVVTG
jgi:hypothetical protein